MTDIVTPTTPEPTAAPTHDAGPGATPVTDAATAPVAHTLSSDVKSIEEHIEDEAQAAILAAENKGKMLYAEAVQEGEKAAARIRGKLAQLSPATRIHQVEASVMAELKKIWGYFS